MTKTSMEITRMESIPIATALASKDSKRRIHVMAKMKLRLTIVSKILMNQKKAQQYC